jgi:hypothetical protein
VISTVDRQSRHTRKSKSKRRDGFRGHVAAEPESGLITDCEMTMAAGEGSTDAENGVKMAGRDRFRRAGPQAAADPGADDDGPQGTAEEQAAGASMVARQAGAMPARTGHGEPAGGADPAEGQRLEVHGDSAYGSGQARADYRDGGHDTVIKPGPLRPAVPGGFTR